MSALFALLTATGCTPTSTLTFANVPTPVLLGPVDRIGGGKGEPTASSGFEVTVEDYVLVASSKGITSGSVVEAETAAASFAVLQATEARSEREVHLDQVKVGAWYYWFWTSIGRAAWNEASGDMRERRP